MPDMIQKAISHPSATLGTFQFILDLSLTDNQTAYRKEIN
jgi:hypothetical protein